MAQEYGIIFSVVCMKGRLDKRNRAQWDALIETEGQTLGLAECRPFLENKIVNDIFYEGMFKGTPCIVKCSSRAPESIANEFAMSRRLSDVDPGVCAEALAKWVSPDGSRAFVVLRKLPGPSLTEMFMRGMSVDEAADCLDDMLRIAAALLKAGIVWRDIIPDNFLRDADGHLKLIDAQFAIDRNDFHEDPYMLAHWRYRTLLFAHHPMMAGRGWNDVGMMLHYARYFPRNGMVKERLARLGELERQAAFPVEYGRLDELRVALCLCGFTLCRLFAGGRHAAALRDRMARCRRFLKRSTTW